MISRAISAIGTSIKKTLIPSIIATGRMISAIGESLFTLPKFIKYITNQDNHPSGFYSSIGVILSSVIVNTSTRIPAIFNHFRSSSRITPSERESTQLPILDDEEIVSEINISHHESTCCCKSSLGYKGMSIYLFLKTLNIAAIPFAFLGSYLNAITFIEFIATNGFKKDAHDAILEYITQSTALALAICGSATYAIYTLKKANANAKKFAEWIEHTPITCDKATAGTVTIMVLGTTTVPFLAFFSANYAMGKIPWIVIPNHIKLTIAAVSTLTRTTTTLLTQTPPLHTLLNSNGEVVRYTATSFWEKPLKAITYIGGLGELSATWISNFTAFVNTSHDVFNIDAKNPGLIALGATTGGVNAIIYFFFSVHEGIKQTIKNARKEEHAYVAISQIENNISLDSMNVDDEFTPYHQTSSFRLFKMDESTSLDLTPHSDEELQSLDTFHYS